MPNGGVPMHMMLYPKSAPYVFYCKGGVLKVIARARWQELLSDAPPIVELDREESALLMRFMHYWLKGDEDRGLYAGPGVRVEFDS